MALRQGATPPAWLGRARLALLADVLVGWRQNLDKLVQVLGLLVALCRPSVVRRRLARLHDLGHIDALPTLPQLLVAARDQMMISATEETRVFYRDQHIPWGFHNLRRFLAGPATMMDPAGLFSARDTIIHHILQTFHRHPHYDLVLLRAHEQGVEELERQVRQLVAGTHLHQRALTSLIEDGSYHQRLPADIAAFTADPHAPARPIPPGLLDDPGLMLGMDQFKDVRGYVRYAGRLEVGARDALVAWLQVAWNETLGGALGHRLGPRTIRRESCDPEVAARHPKAPPART
jgi:hypothetical protein